jgi:hypothetical protein
VAADVSRLKLVLWNNERTGVGYYTLFSERALRLTFAAMMIEFPFYRGSG